ncbi:TPM domain-containing protein [Novosphingobium sp.]|uniref:TPM domain-containing protein n=1 Tax=Novosphingobium sp. TaxID=1874826 RepID=UPI003D12F01D
MTQPTPILSPSDSQKIAAAVSAAEAHANAEIVTVVTRQSDSYADVALVWSALIAALALVALALWTGFALAFVDSLLGLWAHHWNPHEILKLALLAATVKFAVTWLILHWRPLRLLLTPGRIKSARTRARANIAFRLAAQNRTAGATGVVIYLSLAERRAEIVADAAIAAKVAPEVWGDAMHTMLAHFRETRVADGMVAGVAQVGAILAEHFPRDMRGAKDLGNELPDGPIEL